MKVLEFDFVAWMKGIPEIGQATNNQIYGIIRPQGIRPLPEILISRVQTTRQDKFCGQDPLVNADIQVDIYGIGAEQTMLLARLVKQALRDFSGTMGETPVQKVFLSNEFPAFDPDPGTIRMTQTYNFWYSED